MTRYDVLAAACGGFAAGVLVMFLASERRVQRLRSAVWTFFTASDRTSLRQAMDDLWAELDSTHWR